MSMLPPNTHTSTPLRKSVGINLLELYASKWWWWVDGWGGPFLCEWKVHPFSGLPASQLHTVPPTFALFLKFHPITSLVLFIFLDIQQAGNYFHGVDNSPSPPDFGLLCDRRRKIWTKRSMSAFIPFRGNKKKSSRLLRIPPPEVQMYYWWLGNQIGIMCKLVLRIRKRIWIWTRQFSILMVISCPNVLLMVGIPNWYYNFKGRVGKP